MKHDDLQDLLREVASGLGLRRAFSMVVSRVTRLMECDVCSLFILDAEDNSLQLVANHGYEIGEVRDIVIPPNEGVVGTVVRRAEPLNLADVRQHPSYYDVASVNEEDFPRFLAVPLIEYGQVLGVLVAQSATRSFTEDDAGSLTLLATGLAPHIAHALATKELDLHTVRATQLEQRQFKGYAGSPGIAIGTAVLRQPDAQLELVPFRQIESEGIEAALTDFDQALEVVRSDITAGKERMQDALGPEELALFDAYLHMLDDEALPLEVRDAIREDLLWSQTAVKRVFTKHIRDIERSENHYLAERGQDLRDLAQSILAAMQPRTDTIRDIPPDTILVAHEITASMLSEVHSEHLIGFAALAGSMNSHATILARALNLPAVIGAKDIPLAELDNTPIIVDGFTGEVIVNPSPATLERFRNLAESEQTFQVELETIRDLPCETLDGHRINIWVNIGLGSEISRSLDRGAEGIGLFRTEVPFAVRSRFPTEEEQRQIYREHMDAFNPQPVTMRTLDIGGDKDLPYFKIEEDNPFLGWRGIRVTLDHPDIFLQQIRAMFKANAGLEGVLRIMLPMVSNLEEIRVAKRLIDQAFQEIKDEGVTDAKEPQVGVLVEVPSLIFLRQKLINMVDFLAIGTNDLTQYMLAASRTNPRVAEQYQEFDPAMLIALRMLAKTAHEARKPIGICGELAGSVEGAVLCIGMGYDVLSMNATNIPRVKWVVRNITLTNCRRIVARVLRMSNANDTLNYIREQLAGAGLDRALSRHKPYELFL